MRLVGEMVVAVQESAGRSRLEERLGAGLSEPWGDLIVITCTGAYSRTGPSLIRSLAHPC